MKIAFPVIQPEGLASTIAPNIRTAPCLLVVDSQNGVPLAAEAFGGCGTALPELDAVVFSGEIGRGMFLGLQRQGIRLFTTNGTTVSDALAQLAAGTLCEITSATCHGHGQASSSGNSEHSGCGCHSDHGGHGAHGEHDAGHHGCCGGH